MMNCEGLTKLMKNIPAGLDNFNVGLVSKSVRQCQEVKEVLIDLVDADPIVDHLLNADVYRRDKLGKKLGLCFLGPIKDGRAIGRKKIGDKIQEILVDTDKEQIIMLDLKNTNSEEFIVEDIHDFIDGRAVVNLKKEEARCWTLIDRTGKSDILFSSKSFFPPSRDNSEFPLLVYPMEQPGYIYYMKKNSEFVRFPIINKSDGTDNRFHENKAWIQTHDGFWLVNNKTNGIFTLPPEYTMVFPFKDGAALFTKIENDKKFVGLIDADEYEHCKFEIGEPSMDLMGTVEPDNRGYYLVKINQYREYIYFNKAGEVLQDNYISAEKFSDEGFAKVQNDKGYFFIDTQGNNIFGEHYKAAGNFSDGLAWVEDFDGGYYVINAKGHKIFSLGYDEVIRDFHDGISIIEKEGGQKRYVNRSGYTIFKTSPKTRSAGDFENGLGRIRIFTDSGAEERYINKRGKFMFADEESS